MMGYDSFNHVTVMFGGFYGTTPSTAPGTFFKDVWHWTGSAWIPKGNAPRTMARSAFAYDSDRHVFVSNGGNRDPNEGSNPVIGETWEYNAATDTWTQKSIGAGPPHRSLHAMSYDSVRKRMVLAAEGDKGAPQLVWEYDGATSTWTQKPAAPFSFSRNRHAMVFDGTRTLLYGGKPEHTITGPDLADTWSYNGSAWTEITGAGGMPRSRHTMVWDSGVQVAITAYGTSSTTSADDVSTFNGMQWQPTASTPPNRNYSAMAYQTHTSSSVMFAGIGLGDTWILTCH